MWLEVFIDLSEDSCVFSIPRTFKRRLYSHHGDAAAKLKYWTGNYDTYVKTRNDQDVNTIKLYKKQQEEIAHIKEFIVYGANLVRQAKSRQKILDKMEEDGLIEMPTRNQNSDSSLPMLVI